MSENIEYALKDLSLHLNKISLRLRTWNEVLSLMGALAKPSFKEFLLYCLMSLLFVFFLFHPYQYSMAT